MQNMTHFEGSIGGPAIANKIKEMFDLETKGWDTKNTELFLSQIHPNIAKAISV